MESIEEASKSVSSSSTSFIKHVFNFDDDSKNEMMNIIQYSLLAIIPVVALNKGIQRFIPDYDESKGNIEILAEVIGQIIIMFLGILFIHRIITFIPTYSKAKYADFNVTSIILAFLVIVLSLQTKLGEKVNLLLERIVDIVEGKINLKEGQSNQEQQSNGVTVSQPISHSGYIDNVNYQHNNPQMHGTPNPPLNVGVQNTNAAASSSNYLGPKTPLQNAATPSPNNSQVTIHENFRGDDLMAANEALGGSFGSVF